MISNLTQTARKILLYRCTRTLFFRQKSDAGGSAEAGSVKGTKGLVVGVYSDTDETEHKLTPAGESFDGKTGGKLMEAINQCRHIGQGKSQVFENLDSEFYSVAVVGLGQEDLGRNALENIDECKENIRIAAASGVRKLRKLGVTSIECDGFGHPESAGEGAGLAAWRFQMYRNKKTQKSVPALDLYHDIDKDGWLRGLFKAEAQNLARRLSDMPGNYMTPAIFAQNAVDALCPCGVSVEVRDKDWLELKKFNSVLCVAKGSCEPPVFLEISYCGGKQDEKPIVLVGKGITYDTGGLNLKSCSDMHLYRGDMTGAAVVIAVMRAVAALSLPINVQGAIPLCENMPSGMCMKPGDVITGLNGKSIRIDDTDNEGRLVVGDALVHVSRTYQPRIIIDIASMTDGMRAALGGGATGVFTNNNDLWAQLARAGEISGDRVWRFPLWEHFTNKITGITSADLTNVGEGGGTPCRCAAYLQEFVPCGDWIHMDTVGVGFEADSLDFPYLTNGRMTGRPTRTLIQFLYQLACPSSSPKQKLPDDAVQDD